MIGKFINKFGSRGFIVKRKIYYFIKIKINFFWFVDINECLLKELVCKDVSYCRNKIGIYICSCVVKYFLFNWVVGIINIDYFDCYGKSIYFFN